jgi:hypothetical protein
MSKSRFVENKQIKMPFQTQLFLFKNAKNKNELRRKNYKVLPENEVKKFLDFMNENALPIVNSGCGY